MTDRQESHFLQLPGPTPVPERIRRAMSRDVIDHRGPDFADLATSVLTGCQAVFKTEAPVIIYPSSGTGAWEAAIVNTLSPGDRVLMAETGYFADLWRKMAVRWGVQVEFMPGDWRRGVDAAAVGARLAEDKGHAIKAVMAVHNETSTGVTSAIDELRKAMDAAGHPALLLVDTVSSLGSIDYRHDEWGVDVTVSGSQKGLMLPPGLGFTAVSDKALVASRSNRMPRVLLGLGRDAGVQRQGLFPLHPRHHPAVRPAGSPGHADGGGAGGLFRAAPTFGCGHSGGRAGLGPGDPVPGSGAIFPGSHSGDDAARARRRRLPPPGAGALRPVAGLRPRQAGGAGVPHRAPRRLQRPDLVGRPVRGRDGPGLHGRPAPDRRGRRGHGQCWSRRWAKGRCRPSPDAPPSRKPRSRPPCRPGRWRGPGPVARGSYRLRSRVRRLPPPWLRRP